MLVYILEHDLLRQLWAATALREHGLNGPDVIAPIIVRHWQLPQLMQPGKGWYAQIIWEPPASPCNPSGPPLQTALQRAPGAPMSMHVATLPMLHI